MAQRSGHTTRLRRAAMSAQGSTTTTKSSSEGRATPAPGDAPMMFGDLPAATRLQMELVARASDSPEAALADVVSIIVETGGTKCTAIVQAFTDNDSLREQWERTWEVLRR